MWREDWQCHSEHSLCSSHDYHRAGAEFPCLLGVSGHSAITNSRSKLMSSRSFWNLAGRAGRIGHDSVGVIGIAAGDDPVKVKKYISAATGDLVSRLVSMLEQLEAAGNLASLATVIQQDQWADFRIYIAHLVGERRISISCWRKQRAYWKHLWLWHAQARADNKKTAALLDAN